MTCKEMCETIVAKRFPEIKPGPWRSAIAKALWDNSPNGEVWPITALVETVSEHK